MLLGKIIIMKSLYLAGAILIGSAGASSATAICRDDDANCQRSKSGKRDDDCEPQTTAIPTSIIAPSTLPPNSLPDTVSTTDPARSTVPEVVVSTTLPVTTAPTLPPSTVVPVLVAPTTEVTTTTLAPHFVTVTKVEIVHAPVSISDPVPSTTVPASTQIVVQATRAEIDTQIVEALVTLPVIPAPIVNIGTPLAFTGASSKQMSLSAVFALAMGAGLLVVAKKRDEKE